MKPKTFIRLFYLYQFFFDFILIYAVEKLFFLSRGIAINQIGLLLFIWSIMTIVLEVPTGMLADQWSRRKMLILSGVFFSICYTIWIFSYSFPLFLVGFFFRTLGATFASGTLQAYLFDYLKIHNLTNDFEKILGRGNAFRTLGIGTAVAIGGFVSQYSYNIPLIVSAISILTISVVTLTWPEIKPVLTTGEKGYWHLLKGSVSVVRNNKVLLKIVLYSAIVLAVFANLEEFNDIYLKFLGFPNSSIGFIFAVATIGQSIASFYAHKLKSHAWMALNLIAFFGAVVLIVAAFVKHPLMAIAILLLGVMLEFANVLNEGSIQREIKSHQRATVASLNKFLMNILPFQLIYGIIANKYYLQLSYLFLGLVTLTYFVFSPLLNRKSKIDI